MSPSPARSWRAWGIAACLTVGIPAMTPVRADIVRLKDLISLQGISTAPLIGYGLVVGLNKTGDKQQTIFSTQALANMLRQFGLIVPGETIKVENIASVLVTADLPPYARPGSRLDVTASSIGDAKSLQGGTLLATGLRGANGDVVAIAQGALSVGGFGGGSDGSSVQVNHLTVGRVPGGALVEVGTGALMPTTEALTLVLREPDFVTASRVAQTINGDLGGDVAAVLDPGSVSLTVPAAYRKSVSELMARLEGLSVDIDTMARVVINERTGTVVVGGNVRIGAAAVAHGNLSVRISTKYDVSQPAPMSSGGKTTVTPETQVDVREGNAKLVTLEEGTTLEVVTHALNELGATPRDIIAIMQALKAAGALHAELIIL
jgi:flagellar P-ring protein precursor FlgI